MIPTRWRKVVADLGANKTRTLLTVLTILVSVFAVGLLQGISAIMVGDMEVDYQAANPHDAILYAQPFNDDMVKSISRLPGVAGVEGRSMVSARAIQGANNKVNIQLNGILPEKVHVDRLRPANGPIPTDLADREVWVEASGLPLFPLKIGDMLPIEVARGRIRELKVAGFVRDVSFPSSNFTGQIQGYVTPETIEWLGGTRDYSQLLFTVKENRTDAKHVEAVAQSISERLRKADLEVYGTFIYNPGHHFSYEIFMGITTILNVLGGAIVFLCVFLVINTINTLVSQHVRQIGIMKAIGGMVNQLLGMYLVLILSFGVVALIAAIPLGALAAYGAAKFTASFVNIQLQGFRVTQSAVAAQIVTALGVPLIAGLVPVLNGIRISIREALSNYGIQSAGGAERPSFFYRLASRFLSRPSIISLQNIFRRRARLAMILIILTLGGAVFIAVFNLWSALDTVTQEVQGYFLANVNVYFNRPYRLNRLEGLVSTLPGVASTEGWASSMGEVLSPNQEIKTTVRVVAPPADSTLIKPIITAGRWVQAGDMNAIVVGNHLLKARPELRVGDDIVIKMNGKDSTWHIVGFYRLVGNMNPPYLYTNREMLSRVLNQVGTATNLRVITTQDTPAAEKQVGKQLEALFEKEGIQVSQMELGADWRAQQSSTLDVVVYFLLVMALLIALVGGLGLMSTMSMNVLERTREIGVMRSIGASNGEILRMVLVEGLLIGLISWALAVLVSFPLTYVLNIGVGYALFNMALDFSFSWNGLVYWLAGISILAGLASLLPAANAVRLTVRDVLAYE
ncbi:MAG TPA: FtsX-like permease family protein [Anaerolineaceae bacterium]|nr:FtsX-like permease family protein [Anaerolineaceae bacterium]